MKTRWLVITLLAVAACSDPRQIFLSIDTTAGIPCDIDRIQVRAMGAETATYEQEVNPTDFPITLHLNDDTANGTFTLEVVGLKGTDEVLKASGPLAFGRAGTAVGVNLVLEESCTPQAPCVLPDPVSNTRTPAPVADRFVCGQSITRYVASPATEVFSDVCNTPGQNAGKVLDMAGVEGAAKVPLSEAAISNFRFQFYGRPIRQVWVHEDGYISFTTNNPDPQNDLDAGALDRDITGQGVPPPQQSAMIFWDTLTLNQMGVCYALEGSPGTQKLRITWKQTCDISPCGNDTLNFTIVLDERGSKISFTYGDMLSPSNPNRALGASATVGVVNRAVGCAASACRDGQCTDSGMPCGYTQVSSNMAQPPRMPNTQFVPTP